MRTWIALGLALGATFLVYFIVSDPLFQAAAEAVCQNHANDYGYTLIDSQGFLGRRRSKLPDFRCTFESLTGEKIFVDEFDEVVALTGRYRLFRFLGWTLPVVGAGVGMTVAAKLGLIGDD